MTFANYNKAEPGSLKMKCIVCGGDAFYMPGRVASDMFWNVYNCNRCNNMMASPTKYAKCKILGIIAKDKDFNDCSMCDLWKKTSAKGFAECPYYMHEMDYRELVFIMDTLIDKGEMIHLKKLSDKELPTNESM